MTRIDYEAWPRREVYELFLHASNPFCAVTYRQDVTKLVDHCKARGQSFYLSLTYLVAKAVNAVENFRCTVDGVHIGRFAEELTKRIETL